MISNAAGERKGEFTFVGKWFGDLNILRRRWCWRNLWVIELTVRSLAGR